MLRLSSNSYFTEYKILENICIKVEYDENKKEFYYAGGCYEGGLTYISSMAKQDTIYRYFYSKSHFQIDLMTSKLK